MDNLEIVLCDGCSRDATWEKIQAVAKDYLGPKEIILSCNPINMDIVDNYAVVVKLSLGNLIFMAAGDAPHYHATVQKRLNFGATPSRNVT